MSDLPSADGPVPERRPIQRWLSSKAGRCLGLAIVFGLLVLPVAIPLRVIVLACIATIWTWMEAGSLKPLGFARDQPTSTLIWGVGIGVAVTVFGAVVLPLVEQMLGMRSDLSAYGALKGNASVALNLLGMALTSAAFGEEILFRGFLLHQLTALFGSGKAPRWAAIAVSGVGFGLAHMNQGAFGVVRTGLIGTVFAWAWFRTGRNIWALILAHVLVDSYGIAMLYFGLYA